VDEAIAICDVKRFLADWERTQGHLPPLKKPPKKRKECVAIVGSGPAGLTAAYFLVQDGFSVTIFEAQDEAGGMMRTGINAFRLPREILDHEIAAITALGVEIKTSTPVSDLAILRNAGYAAIILCLGAHRDVRLRIPGEKAPNVMGAVEMLRLVNTGKLTQLAGRVVVIGGGNSAIDAARAAVRLGAQEVTIGYRRDREDMPAIPSEVTDAEEEGVKFLFRVSPLTFPHEGEGDRATAVEFVRMSLGELDESSRRRPIPIAGSQFRYPADQIIVAIGQETDWSLIRVGRSR